MSYINQEINALIQADIDGTLSDAEKLTLQQHLHTHPEALAFYNDCQQLAAGLSGLEELEAPGDLAGSIMDAVRESAAASGAKGESPAHGDAAESGWRALFGIWFEFPVLRYATAFLVGALVASSLSEVGVDERETLQTASLAGTMSPAREFSLLMSADHNGEDFQVRYDVLQSGELMQLRFDLTSDSPIDVQIGYASDAYFLFGYSQDVGQLSSLTASDGKISLRVKGEKGFSVFLGGMGGAERSIELTLSREGEAATTMTVSP